MALVVSTVINESADENGVRMPCARGAAGIDVEVVGVSEARGRRRAGRSCWAAMEDYAMLVNERTALRACAMPTSCGAPALIAEWVTNLPSTVAAVFLIGLDPVESYAVQAITAAGEGPLVVAEVDVLTAALAAAAVTMLCRRGIPPGQGRVAVTGADSAPRLGQVLYGAGAGSVALFHQPDASVLPLHRLMTYHDILIDLTSTVPPSAAPDRILRVPVDLFDHAALALPGLLSALCGHGSAVLTLDSLAAAARAVSLCTPANSALPDLHHRLLVPTVARYVSRAITTQSPQRSQPHRRQ